MRIWGALGASLRASPGTRSLDMMAQGSFHPRFSNCRHLSLRCRESRTLKTQGHNGTSFGVLAGGFWPAAKLCVLNLLKVGQSPINPASSFPCACDKAGGDSTVQVSLPELAKGAWAA